MSDKQLRQIIRFLIGLVVVSIIVLGFAFYRLRLESNAVQKAQQQQVDSSKLASELRISDDETTRFARTYVITGDPAFAKYYEIATNIKDKDAPIPQDYHRPYWDLLIATGAKPRPDTAITDNLIQLMEKAGLTDEELKNLRLANTLSTKLGEVEQQAMNMVKSASGDAAAAGGDRERAIQLLFGPDYHKRKAEVMQPLDKFYGMMEARTSKTVADAVAAQNRALYLFVGALLLSLAAIGGLIYFSSIQSKRELAARAAAQKKAEDENEALNNSVISLLQAVNQLSERDLTVRAFNSEDIIGTVADSINSLTEETAAVLHDVTGIAAQVQQVSNNVKSQANLVSRTAEDERQSVNEMVESLLDATQTMNQVAALAEQSNESASNASAATMTALETVNGTVTGMESIRETIAETEKRIKRLGDRSQEISSIVNLINTISERTHVLALNASMQAAVAGEAGRGFAVVAEEVQRLAESSRSATEQIATLVSNIQLETNETINTVNRTIGQVVEGSEQAQKAGVEMRRTQEITSQLVSQVRSIAHASEQQKAMSAQLLEAVQKIGASTEDTAKQIEAQNSETDTLLEASRRLVESVGVFKLPAQTA